MVRLRWLVVSVVALTATAALADDGFCPKVFHKGVMHLDINPAFLHVDQYDTEEGQKVDGLTVSSFFNVTYTFNPYAGIWIPNYPPVEADQVGRIMDIGSIAPADFDFATQFEKLTDLSFGMPKTTWPNEAIRVPDGVLPFEAVIIPQGFHAPPPPGRLSIINLDDPNRQEYLVHQSTLDLSEEPAGPTDEANSPRFYHQVVFHDMDHDGLKDIVTVRSGFKLIATQEGTITMPPFSELVWFKNPGNKLLAEKAWDEFVIFGGGPVGFMGPDIHLAMHDFEEDGIPEIVATHFFSGDTAIPPTKGKIAIYGAPVGGTWAFANVFNTRVNVINQSQGFPFAVEVVDLNADGQVEILATNHQPNCTPYPVTPGQLYVLEQPASGNIFVDEWSVRVLLDNIFPQPTPTGARGMRLAPGHAITFFPKEKNAKPHKRPWILLSGDEAGKVWMLKPKGHGFDYKTAIVFDINDYYGPDTTQTYTQDGLTVSTIGKPALRYARKGKKKCKKNGVTEIYIPVFEAKEIHVLSFKKDKGETRINCPADVTYECVN